MATEIDMMLRDVTAQWTTAESEELYDVSRWGKGYFSIGDNGHLRVHGNRQPDRSIDLKELVERLELRGIDLPVLIRFNEILTDRMREIREAFSRAMSESDYRGDYTCIYPIKVNQQRQVVEQIVAGAAEFGFGLEAGSKPELLAVIAMANTATPIICNGFKDAEYIEMALIAQKLGRTVIPVVERFSELELILGAAERLGVRPQIGMRVKLATRGSGRWESSGGYRSKFGLTVSEMLRGVEVLQQRDMEDCFKMLHFHMGSQITNIRHVKRALNEAVRIYVDLVRMGAGLNMIDVGGGLGVDYDGSQTDFESSVNYTLQEYANDVVYHIQTVCDDEGVPHPTILSESGRALVAYHCVLVFEVLGEIAPGLVSDANADVSPDDELPLRILQETYNDLKVRNMLEGFHDAQQALDVVMNLFSTGHLALRDRARAEGLFWAICRKIRGLLAASEDVPEELQRLDRMLAHTYFCNFSLFQSMPDSWAINQLFPVMPIHRLDQQPGKHAVLADITCDSDGKIDQFIDRREVKRTLRLHELSDGRYLMAAFLIGAYQEILGDLHNLFGDTHAVHVATAPDGEVILESIIKGDTVSEVLDYVEFNGGIMLQRLQTAIEAGVQEGRITNQEAGRYLKFYEDGLSGYTYLEESDS